MDYTSYHIDPTCTTNEEERKGLYNTQITKNVTTETRTNEYENTNIYL